MAKTKKATPSMTALARYESLKQEREAYLKRARDSAKLTLPGLIPEEGNTSQAELYQPFQSVGSRGVNRLAAKLTLALFPPNQPFFRLRIDDYVAQELQNDSGAGYAEAKQEFEKALSRVEQSVLHRLERKGFRSTANEGFKHLLVAGNVLVQLLEDGGARLHPLSRFVVKRDKAGNVIEIVVKETVARMALPEEVRSIVGEKADDTAANDDSGSDDIDIYTRVTLVEGQWEVHQEVEEEIIPGTEGTYPPDKTPWLPLRFIKVDGEDYGRGYVEEFFGDLRTLEALIKAITLFAGAAAKILVFVDESGMTRLEDVSEAESGATLRGSADDVSVLQLEKGHDFQIAKAVADEAKARLEESFLLFSGVRRDAERVTAEEIRAAINELEQGLGGIYAVLSQELQAPLVRRVLHMMQKSGDLPRLPDEAVQPEIITGVDALGRASELVALDRWLAGIAEILGPELGRYVDLRGYAERRGTALGVDTEGLLFTRQEIEQREQAEMQARMVETLGPQAIQANAKEAPSE